MRFYYKSNDNIGFLNLKTPLENMNGYTEITEQEFAKLTAQKQVKPTKEQLERQAKKKEITECKAKLKEYDYIGIKIATGRATIEDYATEIAEMNKLAERINELSK